MEFSLSDLSQEHLTSTEEIIGTNEDEDKGFANCGGRRRTSSPRTLESHSGERANSLDELCTQRLPLLRGSHHLYNGHNPERMEEGGMNGEILSPAEEEGNGYGAYTLPCRRSHCLSEGLSNHKATICSRMQGRRAQTTHVSYASDKWFFTSSQNKDCYESCALCLLPSLPNSVVHLLSA